MSPDRTMIFVVVVVGLFGSGVRILLFGLFFDFFVIGEFGF
ncbi:hypothetical protein LEP1GSC162_1110 [Leptospira santarosai str. CBC1531]|nr:hypothetical protein LEP1GSC162_1110 [Leptospira santarosai str. CBC1531]